MGYTAVIHQDIPLPMSAKPEDHLSPYADALRAHFPAKEDILREAKQQTQQRRQLKKAAVTVASGLLLAIGWLDPVISTDRLHTAIGQQATVQLKDGSEVILNTHTVVVAEQHLRSRQLHLQQGEALFKVKHEWRPFTVYANQTEIMDIGTVFNVRHSPQGAIITVVEGSVEVRTLQEARLLTKDMSVNTQAGTITDYRCTSTNSATAWQHGRLMFDAKPLTEVVAELQRYHAGPIRIADKRIAQYQLSGEYDINGIDTLIDVLPEILPVRVDRHEDQSVVIRSR